MTYEWIFDVLADLKTFAQENGLIALAAKVDETLAVARTEVAGLWDVPSGASPPKNGPPH